MIAFGPMASTRRIVIGSFVALILLGLAWETWLAPLRPGGSLLALKVVPLALALPSLWRGTLRTYQWWSMLILVYVAEGVLRATSDRGPGVALGAIEALLAAAAFGAILLHVRHRIGPRPPRAKRRD